MMMGNPARIVRQQENPKEEETFCVTITGDGPIQYFWSIDDVEHGGGVVSDTPATICIPIPYGVDGNVFSFGVLNKSGADGEDWVVGGL